MIIADVNYAYNVGLNAWDINIIWLSSDDPSLILQNKFEIASDLGFTNLLNGVTIVNVSDDRVVDVMYALPGEFVHKTAIRIPFIAGDVFIRGAELSGSGITPPGTGDAGLQDLNLQVQFI